MNDQNNFLLAVVLSLGVLLAWQFFVIEPRMADERAQQAAQQATLAKQADQIAQNTSDAPIAPTVPNISAGNEFNVPNIAAPSIAPQSQPRVRIVTPKLVGSLALIGARFDDLILQEYRETAQSGAPQQPLLVGGGASNWYINHGWVAAAGAAGEALTLPDENSQWQLLEGTILTPTTPITLQHTTPEGLVLKQHIAVDENYMFTITQSVSNKTNKNVTLYPFGQITRTGRPQTTNLFILHEGAVGFLGEAGLVEHDYDDLVEDGVFKQDAIGGWLGITDKYWATTLVPPQDEKYGARFTGHAIAGTGIGTTNERYNTDYLLGGRTLPQGASVSVTSQFFAGAKVVEAIDAYADTGIERFDLMIDWGWFYFLTKPMFRALHFFYVLLGNYGLSILLVTVLVKLAFFPLANRSYATMAQMKKLQPRMLQIRETHKDNKQAQQQELMKLYREEKLNPLSGCLPILLQIPVFFALYKVLYVTIDMRHQPFFGWVHDLSAPDPTSMFNLFGLLPYDVPSFLLIGIWPLIMGATMFVQMQMNPPPPDPIQARMFQILPIFFTFILAGFPAGLVIYWAWNNFLSILQQGVIMRRHGVAIELWSNLGGQNKAMPSKTQPNKKSPSKKKPSNDKN